ncbi:PhoH family protein [Arthrobacter sp. MYb211]|uniref:PhoH family protein n=1 Tax=Micrococcaceae TaxID=1268 RepID=UPI000BB9B821|nr:MULTISPECIES: PhoH family protein [Micrococcaceae]PCC29109.1 phosphate starvation-inducible protein PhoH [Glutamicibacter sp. BW80]PRA01129.1 PhoH family protein [Arthrobacter sp. MYb224]PRA13850.1 PhoH family protein [Arthrobacter sp. MYb221]PRC09220.1 PhoH family protein [Arthrobacter sp. MYb211]
MQVEQNKMPVESGPASLTITFDTPELMVATLGPSDELLRILTGAYPLVQFRPNGASLTLVGEPVQVRKAQRVTEEARALASRGSRMSADTIEQIIKMLSAGGADAPTDVLGLKILSGRGRAIRPKTLNQKSYVDAIEDNTVTFGVGPAGTGKTFLAMAMAVAALQAKEVSRIILTRPAVEAGEKLGFLPGSLTEKIDPYLRPLYDALHDMIDPETIPRLLEAGTIEVAPLAYMRGRTLNDAFVILDEAQNTTSEQMKMFLTRLGFGSKMVITGDVTQVDLPGNSVSGLRMVIDVLAGIDDIALCRLDAGDVVRHRLIADIVTAYDRWDTQQRKAQSRGRHKS